eukprot:350337-Chlamydomonas_euryale.AAC.6
MTRLTTAQLLDLVDRAKYLGNTALARGNDGDFDSFKTAEVRQSSVARAARVWGGWGCVDPVIMHAQILGNAWILEPGPVFYSF